MCRSWIDSKFSGNGHHRQVNYVLGNIIRLHYPGMVRKPSGESVPARSWDDYLFAPGGVHSNAQEAVWHDFWVRCLIIMYIFLLQICFYTCSSLIMICFCSCTISCLKMETIRRMLVGCFILMQPCSSDEQYPIGGVQANNTYYKEKLGQPMNKNLKSSSIYLTEEQYFQVKHFCALQPYVDVGSIEKYSLCARKDSMVAG